MSKIILLTFSMIYLFISCTPKSNLENALILAEENRSELEKVLVHYEKDSLKYKAACFLIENMVYHSFYNGPELDKYLKYYECVKGNSHRYTVIIDSLNKVNGPFSIHKLKKQYDILYINSEYLIDNIDWAFKVWKEQPWGKNIDFNRFCEYILPYRVGNDVPVYWRKQLHDTYNPILKINR